MRIRRQDRWPSAENEGLTSKQKKTTMKIPHTYINLLSLALVQRQTNYAVGFQEMRPNGRSVLLQSSKVSEEATFEIPVAGVENENVWINGNVLALKPSVKLEKNTFRSLVPPMGKGCDVTVQWSDPLEGAAKLVAHCGIEEGDQVSQVLTEALGKFRDLAIEERLSPQLFKARIVATRGSLGTKCPRWHYDHVPLRHIQALVGAGCDFVVSEEGVDRSFLNKADDADTVRINKSMVDIKEADVRQGREGEMIVLRGLEGCDLPCVHKSPTLPWWQGRVLMTVDVL